MHVNNFFVCGPVHGLFFVQRGRGSRWSTTFPIFGLWIPFGDIRDQLRKLSENEDQYSSSRFNFRNENYTGSIERLHRTFNRMLGKVVSVFQPDWDELLPQVWPLIWLQDTTRLVTLPKCSLDTKPRCRSISPWD